MTPRRFRVDFLPILLLLLSPRLLAADPHALPNVILAMADDQGWGDTGYNGHPILKTPNLDAMSKAGIRFDRFYAPTVCSPTRGSVLTGRHPYRYGIFTANAGAADDALPSKYILPRQEVTIAEALKTRGYTTAHLGKWHLGDFSGTMKSSPDEHGFDYWFSTVRKVQTLDPDFYFENGKRVTEKLIGDDSEIIMDRALKFIRHAAAEKKPFLTLIWFHSPHEPTLASTNYRAMYADRTEKEQHYFGTITATDAQMGRLRSALRELGIADNTMLWYCSDNGPWAQNPGSNGGLRGKKGSLFEGGIREPGILEWPAVVKEPRIVSMPVNTIDYYPTILDYLGITMEKQPALDGISLRPLIEGKMTQRPKPIGFELGTMAVWMENQYKLVARLNGGAGGNGDDEGDAPAKAKKKGRGKAGGKSDTSIKTVMLFDILADPKESTDLAATQPEVTARLRESLEAWRKSCAASLAGADYH